VILHINTPLYMYISFVTILICGYLVASYVKFFVHRRYYSIGLTVSIISSHFLTSFAREAAPSHEMIQ
jgi:hypothetical protein